MRMFRNCRTFNGADSHYTQYVCVCVCVCVCVYLAYTCTLIPHSLTHSLTHYYYYHNYPCRYAMALNARWKVKKKELTSTLEFLSAPLTASMETREKRKLEDSPTTTTAAAAAVVVKRKAPSLKKEEKDEEEEEEFDMHVVPAPAPATATVFPFSEMADLLAQPLTAAMPLKERSRLLMHRAVEYCNALDTYSIFATAVTDDIAPNYSAIIASPMDLSLIAMKCNKKCVTYVVCPLLSLSKLLLYISISLTHTLTSLPFPHRYKTLSDIDADITLMFDNCFAYNAADTEGLVYSCGKQMQKKWKELFPQLNALLAGQWQAPAPAPTPTPAPAPTAEPAAKKRKLNARPETTSATTTSATTITAKTTSSTTSRSKSKTNGRSGRIIVESDESDSDNDMAAATTSAIAEAEAEA
eukprot:GSChrysophyteH1.ASY1.ANO1.1073.1 assembled CDS